MDAKMKIAFALVVLAVGANGQGLGGLLGGGGGGGGGVVSSITSLHKAKLCRKLALIGQGNIAFCGGAKGRSKEPVEEPAEEIPKKVVYVKEVLPKATGDMVWDPKATAPQILPKMTGGMVWEPKATAPVVVVEPKATPVKIVHVQEKPVPAPTKTVVLKTFASTNGVATGHTKIVTSP